MAGKKTRLKKQLRVFILSLLAVLLPGAAVMAGCLALVRQPHQEEGNPGAADSATIDFAGLGQQPEEPAGQTGEENTEEPADNMEHLQAPEEAFAESERLYNEAADKGENVRLVKCADSERVTFAFAGDVLLDDRYAMMVQYRNRGSDINGIFSAGLLERMRGADVFMLNNEFPFSTGGTPTEGKTFTFRADPSNIEIYGQIGVDAVSLANNHAYDYGGEALLDTFTTLEDAGIPYVGAGRNIDEAKKPVYFIANGIKTAVVSATQIERNGSPDTKEATETSAGVLRCMDPAALLEVIGEADANSDFVILFIHWGTESQEDTDWLQNDQAPKYVEAGADLIIGAHPHCLQKIDVVSGVPVVYSLGNFWFNSKTVDTCLAEVAVNQDGIEYLRFVACRQENCRTGLLEGTERDSVLNYMRRLSPNVSIDNEGYVTF